MDQTRNHFQRNTSWNAPYTFSGKEKDAETGYGYFGARYYDSSLSIWLSVDPMSDKYPSMSPYNYCANNPVILVDPDGRDIDPTSPGAKIAESAATEFLADGSQNPNYEAAFASIYNSFKNNHSIVVRFDHTSDESTIKYNGTNDKNQKIYTVLWDETRTTEQGASGIFEESYHLFEALEGFHITFSANPKNGMHYVDIYDEVRTKLWVIDNIKSVQKFMDLDKDDYGYTHYGYIMTLNGNTSDIISFLTKGVNLEGKGKSSFKARRSSWPIKYTPCCVGSDYAKMSQTILNNPNYLKK